MASTSAFTLTERQENIIAPDDSDFLDSDAESTPHPDDELIESAVLEDLQATPHRSRIARNSPGKLWPAHPLIRIHKRLWFTWFTGDLPVEDDLNRQNGQSAAWTNFDDAEIKKYVDASETKPKRLHWFNIDHDLVYLSFWFDWGPLNVGMFYRFCLHVHHMLTDPDMQDATLVLYTTDAPAQKANAALLVTLYAMIIGKVTPADAFYPISEVEFKPFRDAGYGRADYNLSIQDILYGVHRAINEGLLDLTTFNLDEYEKYEQVSNGDWNWITPNFIAFASPNDRNYVEALRVGEGRLPSSYSFRPPGEDKLFGRTIRYFKDRGVKLVVRLNNPLYDREAFLNAGIDHSDMYFDDGSNPTDEILTEFIAKADKVIAEDGVVAVHCKAGLGRTGVLIGAYLVWKHGFSAGEAIGFMRFMRPGCVVGPQQHFMYQNFVEWVKWGVRDHAMKEAKQLIAQERVKFEAAQATADAAVAALAAANARTALASPGPAAARASIKRRAVGSDAAKGAEDDSFEVDEQLDADNTADQSLDDDVKHAQVHKQARKKLAEDEQSDDDDEQRPRQKQKADAADHAHLSESGPVTPKAQRGTLRGVPQSAAPGVKPAPCVGQPRKSPSPSRKRPAIQAPATVARLELTSRRYPAATRSFNQHLMLSSSSQSVHVDPATATSGSDHLGAAIEAAGSHDADSDSANGSFSNDTKVRGAGAGAADFDGGAATEQQASSPRNVGVAAGVLVESRINIAPVSTTPRASPKAAMVNLTPSPVARVRGFERTRSNSIATATVATPVRGSSRRDTTTVSASPKPEVFRASPNIRDRYGLRDSSKSPPPPLSPQTAAPATPRSQGATSTHGITSLSRHASPVKLAPTAKMTDAEVLGVIDCIPQPQQHQQMVSSRHVSPRPSPAKVKMMQSAEAKVVEPMAVADVDATGADENMPTAALTCQPPAAAALAATAPAVVVHRAPLTVQPKVLRSVRSKSVLSSSNGNGAASTGNAAAGSSTTLTTGRVATVRKPLISSTTTSSARTTTASASSRSVRGTSVRSVSAKIAPSSSSSSSAAATGAGRTVRAQKSIADLRPKHHQPGARSVSNSSNSSTTATVTNTTSGSGNGSGSRPGSRLTAPTAASAARAAEARAKRLATTTTPNPSAASSGAGGGGAGMVRKTSTTTPTVVAHKSTAGATTSSTTMVKMERRARRSSTGEAGLDVVA